MKIKLIIMNALLCVVFTCCGQQKEKAATTAQPETYEMVSIPTFISDPSERVAYLLDHYWDKFDFVDTANMHKPDYTEQALSNYIEVLRHSDEPTVRNSIRKMLEMAAKDSLMYNYFVGQYEKYLDEPNSPMRNETLFTIVLENVIDMPVYAEVSKIRPRAQLELARKNRVGEKALDFHFTLSDGKKEKLYDIKAEKLLVFFYNPDCDICANTRKAMEMSPYILEAIDGGKLKILALYPGADTELWSSYGKIPSTWINGYDADGVIDAEELYDIRSIPTMYLLDKDKKVIVKDGTFDQIESAIVR